MRRAAVLIIALASAGACGAWSAHARAAALSSLTEAAAAPRPPVPSPTTSRKIDEYGNVRWGDEQLRLDHLAAVMRDDPTHVAYLVCYGGRRARAGEARQRCARAARYLSMVAAIAPARVVTLDGGFREDLTVELWALPASAQPPALSPTVDPSEVSVIKDTPGRKRRPRARRANPTRAAAPRGVTPG